jgi:hypothetical protein
MGTSVEFNSPMTCPQTTHFAVLLLSLPEGRECVTAYSAPQREQKKEWPSGIGPVRGMAASHNPDLIMYSPKK